MPSRAAPKPRLRRPATALDGARQGAPQQPWASEIASGLFPDLVLCSPARRAQDTWQIVAGEFTVATASKRRRASMTSAMAAALLEVIRRRRRGRSLMLVGHNPSMEELARRLIGRGDRAVARPPGSQIPHRRPGSHRTFPGTGPPSAGQSGELIHFIRPRDLAGAVRAAFSFALSLRPLAPNYRATGVIGLSRSFPTIVDQRPHRRGRPCGFRHRAGQPDRAPGRHRPVARRQDRVHHRPRPCPAERRPLAGLRSHGPGPHHPLLSRAAARRRPAALCL